MTTFDYALSNSLLKRQIEEKGDGDNYNHSDGTMPSKDGASPSLRLESFDSAESNTAAIPVDGPAKSTSKTKKKTLPTKKTQHSKHKFANGSTTAPNPTTNKTFVVGKEKDAEPKSGILAENSGGTIRSNAKEATESEPKKKRIRKPRRVIPKEKEYIPENEQPTQYDVVGGRGGRSNHHPGNRPYWIRILESRLEYTRSRSDIVKASIANGILFYVQQELKGRFLNLDSKTKRWYILPDAVVLDKIKQALRDKYIPFWARDLKIENKTQDAVNVSTNKKDPANDAFSQLLGHTKAPALNSMAAFGPSLGVPNSFFVNQAVQLAAIKASRANAAGNAFGLPRVTAQVGGQPGFLVNPAVRNNNDNKSNSSNETNNDENNLGFLFGASAAKRARGPTASIPTVDDILKCKVDQMPSFGGNNGFMTANPFISSSIMNSLGLGGLPAPNPILNDATHRGFGAGGNPGAPGNPFAASHGIGTASMSPSIGFLQSLNMRSFDKFMEGKKAGGPSAGATTFDPVIANIATINMMSALGVRSFDSSTTHAPAASLAAFTPAAAKAPATEAGTKKTDWNAMFAKALTKSK